MRRIAFVNEKGGTGKTTLAVHVAAWIARARKLRVLLVDLDTQGHAGKTLGLDVREIKPNVFHFLTDPAVRLDQVHAPTEVPGLSVVPAYKQMAGLAAALGTVALRRGAAARAAGRRSSPSMTWWCSTGRRRSG